MSNDDTKPNWTARAIAACAVVLALVGGVSLLSKANGTTKPVRVTIATSCNGFETDARKAFDKGDIAELSGKFAPGDRVHLAIDIAGVGYTWELSGVLAKRKTATTNGTSSYSTSVFTASLATINGAKVARGRISGYTTLELDIDVTEAGDGAITFSSGSLSVPMWPNVASASCTASKQKARSVAARLD